MDTPPLPPPPGVSFSWPSDDLRNLVKLAPTSPYTRALLRIKFNRPVPDSATTFEQIESWLAEIKPVAKPPAEGWQGIPTAHQAQARRDATYVESEEIERGEYILVTGSIEGYELRKEYYKQHRRVRVPLSIWREAIVTDRYECVEEYVAEKVRTLSNQDVYECENDGGEETSFETEEDLEDCAAEAQEMLIARGLAPILRSQLGLPA